MAIQVITAVPRKTRATTETVAIAGIIARPKIARCQAPREISRNALQRRAHQENDDGFGKVKERKALALEAQPRRDLRRRQRQRRRHRAHQREPHAITESNSALALDVKSDIRCAQ